MSADANVAALARNLADRWQSTHQRWRDGSGRDFEEHHLSQLLDEARAVAEQAEATVRDAQEAARRSGA